MRILGVLVVAACYAPTFKPGSPCDLGPCPAGLVCSPATQTCELVAVDASTLPDTAPAPDATTSLGPPANDTAGGAIDVSAGGTFTADLTYAHDDLAQLGCGGDGGRDVFYTITLPSPEVIYLDTFGSDFGTDLRVFSGKACTALNNPGPSQCNRDACGGAESQLAMQLPAGTSCIVVDQHAGDSQGALALVVKRGGRSGSHLGTGTQATTGDTCASTNASSPPAGCAQNDSDTAKDAGYYFTACPGEILHLVASTCADATQTHFDTVMYLRPVGGAALDCNDDTPSCMARTERPNKPDGSTLAAVPAMGPDLFWLTVDGYNGACGGYLLTTALQ